MLAIRLEKLLKEQEEQIKNRDESLEKAREEIKWLRGMLKEQETKWIHREDLDFKDKLGCNHFHGMCGNCGFIRLRSEVVRGIRRNHNAWGVCINNVKRGY